jgi:hypothetical protein
VTSADMPTSSPVGYVRVTGFISIAPIITRRPASRPIPTG